MQIFIFVVCHHQVSTLKPIHICLYLSGNRQTLVIAVTSNCVNCRGFRVVLCWFYGGFRVVLGWFSGGFKVVLGVFYGGFMLVLRWF